ncbi:luciferase family oxidoreductase, group 1 [Streptomyces sp. OV198]|uniref:MsnO8 family LLM class oxidoreductase n=1 Tax=unclassified Streptomyces TaxID=2593676 RepID=UPI000BC82355|nr:MULTISPECIES: MsnO8 family LLM class oxidoreductase [unclassified Streptomyces]PBC93119.1 luciferase family oxidoreductase group 1 [Streptomyces sp. Ag82_O1-15]SOF03000.1 luciferase family oxidoreductase, group 1 [Streptomyces sp. OV198]
MTLRLSILDQSPIPAGGAPAEALIATLQLARSAEGLGYHRFWVAEHHGAAGFAGIALEVMVASMLENTRRLRIGSGGVLLPRYEPRKVAEVFRVLGALHPGRVDLGIGRAGGIARDFPRRFAEVIDLLGKSYPGYIPPTVWLLGAGSGSARLADALGTRYAFAHFLSPQLSNHRTRPCPPGRRDHRQYAHPRPGRPAALVRVAGGGFPTRPESLGVRCHHVGTPTRPRRASAARSGSMVRGALFTPPFRRPFRPRVSWARWRFR